MVKKSFVPSAYRDEKKVSYVFLGVGLSLFILNVAAMMSFNPAKYSYYAFDISVFASMMIVIYTVYILHKDEVTEVVKHEKKRHF